MTAAILLTSLGEGTRDYIVKQFTQFGTSIVAVNPGKVKTLGMPGVLGGTTHKSPSMTPRLFAISRTSRKWVPWLSARLASREGEGSQCLCVWGGWEAAKAFRLNVAQGSFLPESDPNRKSSYAVLGRS